MKHFDLSGAGHTDISPPFHYPPLLQSVNGSISSSISPPAGVDQNALCQSSCHDESRNVKGLVPGYAACARPGLEYRDQALGGDKDDSG